MNEGLAFYYEELLKSLYNKLLAHPDCLRLQSTGGAEELGGSDLLIRMAPHAVDYGLIAGSNGVNLRAVQVIFAAISKRRGEIIEIRLLEPWIGEKERLPRVKTDHNWEKCGRDEPLTELMLDLLHAAVGGIASLTVDWQTRNGQRATVYTIPDLELEMVDSLNTLWHAIGRAHGRYIIVNAHSGANTSGDTSRTLAR